MSRESIRVHRPIFISSTFNDFQAERDHLRRVVFPALEERVRHERLLVNLETIDLRWGVDTLSVDVARRTTATDNPDIAKQLMVLKVCLDEIERSRPFMIVLLGDRYGWTPPHDRMKWAAGEKGLAIADDELIRMSVTALEVEYGILNNPEEQKRCRIYLRCLDYHEMPKTEQQHYLDPEDSEAAFRLTELKGRLFDQFPDRVYSYSVNWDKDQKKIHQPDLHAWGKVVIEQLWQDIRSEFGSIAGCEKRTWQQDQREIIEEFVEDRSRDFIERGSSQNQSIVDALVRHALSSEKHDDEWGLCLTGDAGMGKSSIFAAVYRRLLDKDVVLLAHAAGVGGQSARIDLLLLRWIGELCAVTGESLSFANVGHPSVEQLQATFDSLLTKVSLHRRVVILLDALDQFERTPRARQMTWIPRDWPRNARLIATAIEGSESEALTDRQAFRVQPLEPLSGDESRTITTEICRRRYHREVRAEIVNEIVSRTIPGSGQPAAGNPLWLNLAVEEINLVDADDFARARAIRSLSPDEQLHQMLLEVAHNLPPTVEEIYSKMLQRAEKVSGTNWANAFACLIALSRTGLRETDLKVLLPMLTGEPWNDYQFAILRRSFRAHLVFRGDPARYDFFHRQMRMAVQRRYLSDHLDTSRDRPTEGVVQMIHKRMADHFETLSDADPLAATELIWHLASAGDRIRSAILYNSVHSAKRVDEVTETLLSWLLDVEGESRVKRSRWIVELVEVEELTPDQSTDLAQRLVTDFDSMLAATGELKLRIEILSHLRECGIADQSCTMSLLSIRLGEVQAALGNIKSALEEFRRAEKVLEWMSKSPMMVDRDETLKQLSRLQSRIAELLLSANQLDQARTVIEKQSHAAIQNSLEEDQMLADLKIADKEIVRSPDKLRDRALALENQGDLSRKNGQFSEAEGDYLRAFQIRRQLVEQFPDNKVLETEWLIIHAKLGGLKFQQKAFEEAAHYLGESLQIARSLSNRFPEDLLVKRNLAAALMGNAKFHIQRQQFHNAEEQLLQALKLRQQLTHLTPDNVDVRRDLTECYILIAVLELTRVSTGEPSSTWVQECLDHFHELSGGGQQLAPEVIQIRDRLERIHRDQSTHAAPVNHAQKTENESHLLITIHDQAVRHVQAGRTLQAIESLKQLEQLAERLDERVEVILALEQQAIAFRSLERFDEAESVIERLILKCRAWNDRQSLIFALGYQSQLLRRRNVLEPALNALKEAEAICRSDSLQVPLKSILFHQSEVLTALGRNLEADAAMAELRMLEMFPF